MQYYAALVPDNEIEERRFVALGFPLMEVEGGPCARVKIEDWMKRIPEIGSTFAEMERLNHCDPTRPKMEYYRSFSELHLLAPVINE